MWKRTLLHGLFWSVVLAFYTVYFGSRDDVYGQSLFFVGLLLPITMATTYVILYWLIPGYLLTRRFFLFGLYGGYILLTSLYLEFSLLVGLYIFVADYKALFISASLVDQTEILVGMYAVVLGASTVHFIRRWDEIRTVNVELSESMDESERTIERLQREQKAQNASISVRADRKNHPHSGNRYRLHRKYARLCAHRAGRSKDHHEDDVKRATARIASPRIYPHSSIFYGE